MRNYKFKFSDELKDTYVTPIANEFIWSKSVSSFKPGLLRAIIDYSNILRNFLLVGAVRSIFQLNS